MPRDISLGKSVGYGHPQQGAVPHTDLPVVTIHVSEHFLQALRPVVERTLSSEFSKFIGFLHKESLSRKTSKRVMFLLLSEAIQFCNRR